MIFSLGASFDPDLLNKKGTKCGPFTEKNRPTQEVQHLISSFCAGPRRIWDRKLILYGPLYSGPFSEGRFPPPPPQSKFKRTSTSFERNAWRLLKKYLVIMKVSDYRRRSEISGKLKLQSYFFMYFL